MVITSAEETIFATHRKQRDRIPVIDGRWFRLYPGSATAMVWPRGGGKWGRFATELIEIYPRCGGSDTGAMDPAPRVDQAGEALPRLDGGWAMFSAHDVVRLRHARPPLGLAAGQLGTIVMRYAADPPAYEVEF